MRSVQSGFLFPLSAVKPLEGLLPYRTFCLERTRSALGEAQRLRTECAACGSALTAAAAIDGLSYAECPTCASWFLSPLPPPPVWGRVLAEVNQHRRSARSFHAEIADARNETVYQPKLEWIRSTLSLQGIRQPRLLEVTTPPANFSPFLHRSNLFRDVTTLDESVLETLPGASATEECFEAAVVLESLDRVSDPRGLLRAVTSRLVPGGLLFVTALVRSGFDFAVLGVHNKYLYPPDRANCFSLDGLERLVSAGHTLIEVSTPGVLDVEIVRAHLVHDPAVPISKFERQMVSAEEDVRQAFQTFLQEQKRSSFARAVAQKRR